MSFLDIWEINSKGEFKINYNKQQFVLKRFVIVQILIECGWLFSIYIEFTYIKVFCAIIQLMNILITIYAYNKSKRDMLMKLAEAV